MQIYQRLVVLSVVHILTCLLIPHAPVLAGQVTLAWDAPDHPGEVEGYMLYYWQSTWQEPVRVDVGHQTTYTLTGLEDGKIYHFAVTAYTLDEEEESQFSNEVVTLISSSPPLEIPVDSSPAAPADASDLIVIEAEAMTLTGYHIQSNADASDGQLISIEASGASGQASSVFPGPNGIYEVIVAYFDENDGESKLEVTINGVVVDTWVADEELPAAVADAATLVYRVVAPRLSVAPGQVVELKGSRHRGEDASVDKIEFLPVR